jgi:hypothetical protein
LKAKHAILSAAVGLLLLGASSAPVKAQASSDVQAFINSLVGRWQNYAPETNMGRNGPHALYEFRAYTYSYIFSAKDPGVLHMDIYAKYPEPKADRSVDIVPDGKPHECGAECSGQGYPALIRGAKTPEVRTYTYYMIDAHMMIRLEIVNGKIFQYLFYALSTDGQKLSLTSWNPKTPYWQNLQVFTKQQ